MSNDPLAMNPAIEAAWHEATRMNRRTWFPQNVKAIHRAAFRLENRPAIINFSGGRSSAYMTYHLLEAYGGYLPDDVVVVFCNTGKEHDETLDFVQECSDRWLLPIHWLEYRFRAEAAGGHHFAQVNYHTASRNGEPFEQLITTKTLLPNVTQRICTSYLKVHVAKWFATRKLGWKTKQMVNLLGMRFDEPKRIHKTLMEMCKVEYPLYHAEVTKPQVNAFWSAHPFDLQLKDDQGNCDLCFLKGGKYGVQGDLFGLDDDDEPMCCFCGD